MQLDDRLHEEIGQSLPEGSALYSHVVCSSACLTIPSCLNVPQQSLGKKHASECDVPLCTCLPAA